MRVLSLFTGVGGFDLGLEAAGWRTVFQCEIDPHCQQTLAYHWPDVPRWDDVTTLTGRHILNHCDGVDVVAWGSPCQDLSVAGKRAGLSGERSGLFHHGIRIIKELRELTNGQSPTWSIWENVAGALSSNGGADFGQVLHEMDEAGACFSEWAVLDAQHFGVPQRRRRVFVISCFDTATADRCGTPLLPVAQGGAGDSAKGDTARSRTANTASGGVASRRRLVVEDVVAFSHTQGLDAQPSSAHTPTLRTEGGGAAVAYAYDEYNDTLGGDTHHALRAGTRQSTGVLVEAAGFKPGASADARSIGYEEGVSPSLEGGGGGNNRPAVLTPTMHVRRLTPLECERLMGWPDNHTLPRADGKTNSDTNRYKMCGNGVASPVATWIAEQINAVT